MKTLIITLALLISSKAYVQTCKEVVGYYPNWQWYDRNKLVNPASIDYSKYSIINYAFFAPQSDGTIDGTDAWADENLLLGQIDWSNGGYVPNTSIVDIAHNNNVQILPSIGGWTLSNNFPTIASDPNIRAVFVQSCINLIQQYNFDGIDLDWEYPGFPAHGGGPQDKANFNLLLQDLRLALDNYEQTSGKTMLLTAAVGAGPDRMDDVDWPVAAQYLDIINLMSYDFFGTWDPITNHNAPLFKPAQGDPEFNIACTVERLINDYQVDPNKVTVGLAFYGRSAMTQGPAGLFSASSGLADNSTFYVDQGTPLYYSVLDNLSQFTEHWDSSAMVPYLTGNNGLNTFVSYDNELSIELKSKYIMDKNLRGAIIWEITGDYIESAPGSGIISDTPLANKINDVFCNYLPGTSGLQNSSCSAGGSTGNTDTSSVGVLPLNQINIQVYPNPAKDHITIKTSNLELSCDIISAHGQVVKSVTLNTLESIVSVSDLATGLYYLRFKNSNEIIRMEAIVVE